MHTCGKPSSKEDVEEFLWGNVSLKVSVEASVVSRATVAGVLGCVRSCWLISVLIILLPLLWITQHCICITYCCWEREGMFGLCPSHNPKYTTFINLLFTFWVIHSTTSLWNVRKIVESTTYFRFSFLASHAQWVRNLYTLTFQYYSNILSRLPHDSHKTLLELWPFPLTELLRLSQSDL